MHNFCLKLKKISVHPISLIVWLWLFIVLGPVVAINYVLAIAFHEMGHFFVAKILGYRLTKFSFSPYGVSLSYDQQELTLDDEIKIAVAGPIMNFVTAFFVVAVWWIFPESYCFSESFVVISVLLGLFNLLPAYPLDGGRLFICLTSMCLSQKLARRITIVFNVLLSVVFSILFVVFCFINFNPTYLLFAIFLAVGALEINQNSKYIKPNLLKREYKNFSKIRFCYIDENTTLKQLIKKLETGKTQIFCLFLENGKIINLSEKLIIKLSLNYDLNTTIKDILKK